MSRYEPGPALAAVAAGGAALLDGNTSLDVVERVWRALTAGGGGDALGSALGILVETFGVSALPPFALAVGGEDGARVVVRGNFEALISGGAGTDETVRADGPTFWVERHVADATGVVLRGGDGGDLPSLPVVDGVVWASAVVLGEPAGGRDESAPVHADEVTPSAVSTAQEPTPVTQAVDASEAGPDEEDLVSTLPDGAETAGLHSETAGGGQTLAPQDTTIVAADTDGEPSLSVEEGTTAYDHLIFGLTRVASVEDAAVRAPEQSPSTPSAQIGAIPPAGPDPAALPSAPPLGDHDGLTISGAQFQTLRGRAPSGATGSREEPRAAAPVLVVSTGERAVLDRGAVVGVRPSVVRATGIVPHLIAVPSPSGEISRRHLEIRTEASHILAVDLDSTNGTRLLREGADPVRLHPGAATLLVSGDRLDLGDGVQLSFEGLQ